MCAGLFRNDGDVQRVKFPTSKDIVLQTGSTIACTERTYAEPNRLDLQRTQRGLKCISLSPVKENNTRNCERIINWNFCRASCIETSTQLCCQTAIDQQPWVICSLC